MPRYIDADALIAELQKKPIRDGHFIHTRDVSDVIFNAPTLSPDDVRGVGKWTEDRMDYRCSVCGKSVKDEIFYMFEPYQMPPYCPNCGARMEVSEDA